jgi:phosphonatase-like hydrolase
MIPFELAIFDLAGTTVQDDDAVGTCLQGALGTIDLAIEMSEATAVMGIPKPIAIAQLLSKHGRTGDVDQLHAEFQTRMRRFYAEEPIQEIKGTSDCFRQLREFGLKIGIDTGFDRLTTDLLLSRMPWDGLIDDSITSDEVANGRPAPDMVLALAARQGVRVERVIKGGDTPSDLGEGRSAGVGLNVGVLSGGHTRAQLESHPHDLILGSIAELPDWLRANYG